MNWFLYDNGIRRERVNVKIPDKNKAFIKPFEAPQRSVKIKI